jgi:hypothetical protein
VVLALLLETLHTACGELILCYTGSNSSGSGSSSGIDNASGDSNSGNIGSSSAETASTTDRASDRVYNLLVAVLVLLVPQGPLLSAEDLLFLLATHPFALAVLTQLTATLKAYTDSNNNSSEIPNTASTTASHATAHTAPHRWVSTALCLLTYLCRQRVIEVKRAVDTALVAQYLCLGVHLAKGRTELFRCCVCVCVFMSSAV